MADIAPILLVVGTRPEAIKLLPLYFALKKKNLPVLVCTTMQHAELLKEPFSLFNVVPDYNFNIMRIGQDIFYITQLVLQKTKELLQLVQPSLVIVQGDTTSAFSAALAAFYKKIPVAHIEAGLRTHDMTAPFPEEMNRRVLQLISTYHFAPTSWSAGQLLAESQTKKNIFCVGNTIVDAIRIIRDKIKTKEVIIDSKLKQMVELAKKNNKKIILFTMHRRESFGEVMHSSLTTLANILKKNNDLFCFYPYHPNPSVMNAVKKTHLSELENLLLTEPLLYHDLIFLIEQSDLVVTDSGGLQEEAVSCNKPVIILRENTERMEAVWAGAAELVGSNQEKFELAVERLLYRRVGEHGLQEKIFGNGFSADSIAHILREQLKVHKAVEINTDVATKVNKIHNKKKVFFVKNKEKKIAVFGLGYIGLPTSIVLADAGYEVVGIDTNEKKVASINSGDPTLVEPDLFEKLAVALSDNNFFATTNPISADVFIVAVPTPITEVKTADLSFVWQALDTICHVLKKNDLIVIESTIPVGTTQKIALFVQEKTGMKAGIDVFIAHCPERVLPGNIFYELVHNDRIIGGISEKSVEEARKFYAAFVVGSLYLTDDKTAELVKLVENSARDTQIAFAHQVADMATEIDRNPYEVIELANKHPRVNILQPSCGVGGHCLAVDPYFLIETFKEKVPLIASARKINDNRSNSVVFYIENEIDKWKQNNKTQSNPTVSLFGATYKANIDDLRESAACNVIKDLSQYKPLICDPFVSAAQGKKLFGSHFVKINEAVSSADIIVFLVKHTQFTIISKWQLKNKTVLDFCGIMHKLKEAQNDQEYYFWPASKKEIIDQKKETTKDSIEYIVE